MSNRNARRRQQRMEGKGYSALLSDLSPRDRHQINEKVIWAVNQLTDLDGRGPRGIRFFIEERAKQLVIDIDRHGFRKASHRFRTAISARKKQDAEEAKKLRECQGMDPDKGGLTLEREKAFKNNGPKSQMGRGIPPTIGPEMEDAA